MRKVIAAFLAVGAVVATAVILPSTAWACGDPGNCITPGNGPVELCATDPC